MAKEKKTYRLSEEAIAIIQNRDRIRYPTANDFVEKLILESGGKDPTVLIEKRLDKLQENDKEILAILRKLIEQEDGLPVTTL